MGKYLKFLRSAKDDYLTSRRYDFTVEFEQKINRGQMQRGTKMPITDSITVSLRIDIVSSILLEEWEKVAYEVYFDAEITELGVRLLEEELAGLKDDDYVSIRVGTIAIWGCGQNERYRQVYRVEQVLEDPEASADIEAVRQIVLGRIKESVSIYQGALDMVINIYHKLVRGEKLIQHAIIKERVIHYIKDTDKEESSIKSDEGLKYMDVAEEEDLVTVVIEFAEFLVYMKENLYSNKRVNPKYHIEALRARILDILKRNIKFEVADRTTLPRTAQPTNSDIKSAYPKKLPILKGHKDINRMLESFNLKGIYTEEDELKHQKAYKLSGKGRLSRSRRPKGIPPFSNLWMFLTKEEKAEILTWMLNELETLYGVKFYDPIRYNDFYYKFTHFEPGLYIFGDNGLYINDGRMFMYDLSISDSFQSIFRKDGNLNLSFFVCLWEDLDQGTSGDPFTSIWTIEGQLACWRAFLDGKLHSRTEFMIKGFIEVTDVFLGHYWDEKRKRWRTKGVRISRDKADKREGFDLKKQRYYDWPADFEVEAMTVAQTALASGASSWDLAQFYEWIKEKSPWLELEYAEGVSERIFKMLPDDLIKEFINHFDRNELARLAKPKLLIDGEEKID